MTFTDYFQGNRNPSFETVSELEAIANIYKLEKINLSKITHLPNLDLFLEFKHSNLTLKLCFTRLFVGLLQSHYALDCVLVDYNDKQYIWPCSFDSLNDIFFDFVFLALSLNILSQQAADLLKLHRPLLPANYYPISRLGENCIGPSIKSTTNVAPTTEESHAGSSNVFQKFIRRLSFKKGSSLKQDSNDSSASAQEKIESTVSTAIIDSTKPFLIDSEISIIKSPSIAKDFIDTQLKIEALSTQISVLKLEEKVSDVPISTATSSVFQI